MSSTNRDSLVAKLMSLDPNTVWMVSAKPRKDKRTIEQNRRLWDLYTAIGDHIGETKDRVHELMGWKFLRYQDVVAGQQVELIKSTTKLNTKEMAEYQEAIERWAAMELGFVWDE